MTGVFTTFNSGDSIDGRGESGGDGDIIDLQVGGSAAARLPYASVVTIETIRIQDMGEGDCRYDFSRMDGEKKIISYRGLAGDRVVRYQCMDDAATIVVSGLPDRTWR